MRVRMKRVGVAGILLFLLATTPARAQISITTTAGVWYPDNSHPGFTPQLQVAAALNETFGVGISGAFYRRAFDELSFVEEYVDSARGLAFPAAEVELTRTVVPVMLNLTARISMLSGWFARTAGERFHFDTGPLLALQAGYLFVSSREANGDLEIEDDRRYGDWGWGLTAGWFYQLGENSDIVAAISYLRSKVERKEGETIPGLPRDDEVSLSGAGLYLGMRFGL